MHFTCEIRGRPIRFETVAGDAGFVPRLHLGYLLSVVPINDDSTTADSPLPRVQLSESLVGDLSSTDTGPSIDIDSFADPNDEPAIRLTVGDNTENKYFLVTLAIMEQKDEDRTAAGT